MENEVLSLLDWSLPRDEQLKNVRHVAELDLNPLKLFMPGHKKYWGNAALVLLMMGSQKTKPILRELFVWLQDLNWPGAYIIMELLFQFPEDMLLPMIAEMRRKAEQDNDDNWVNSINSLEDPKERLYVIARNHLFL